MGEGVAVTYTATLNGVTIGAGTDYTFSREPTGLGPGSYRTSRSELQWTDGSRPSGPDLLASRMVAFEIGVRPSIDAADIEALVDALKAAWAPVRSGTIPLTLELANGPRILNGRPEAVEVDYSRLPFGAANARLVFEATDPRLYSASSSSIVLGLTAGGGMSFPLTFPLTFGAGSDSDGSAANSGTIDAPWSATIIGPVTTPRITLGETGEFVELDGVVPAGSTVVIDSLSQSILLDGSPRQSWQTLLSRWWALAPGANTVRFRAASGTGSCTFTWRSAWL